MGDDSVEFTLHRRLNCWASSSGCGAPTEYISLDAATPSDYTAVQSKSQVRAG